MLGVSNKDAQLLRAVRQQWPEEPLALYVQVSVYIVQVQWCARGAVLQFINVCSFTHIALSRRQLKLCGAVGCSVGRQSVDVLPVE